MPKKGANISLSSYDDIFSTEESREEAAKEQVHQIPISELHPFEGHPFRVVDDESMTRTMESIAQFGVIAPLLARPDPDGGYEIISGHRRKHAAELVGLETLPVTVREMNDDEAIIAMVDSNLQRETILPSERAWAYKMKMDAIKHQGKSISRQVGEKSWSVSQVSAASNDSERQVHRYIHLTNLLPELMDMVDEKKIAHESNAGTVWHYPGTASSGCLRKHFQKGTPNNNELGQCAFGAYRKRYQCKKCKKFWPLCFQ